MLIHLLTYNYNNNNKLLYLNFNEKYTNIQKYTYIVHKYIYSEIEEIVVLRFS